MFTKEKGKQVLSAVAVVGFMVWWNWDTSIGHAARDAWDEGNMAALTSGGPCNQGLATARELLGENEVLAAFMTPEQKKQMKERGYQEGSWIRADRSTITVDREDKLGNVVCSVNYTIDMKKQQEELRKFQDPKDAKAQKASDPDMDARLEKVSDFMGNMLANTPQRATYSVKKTTGGDLWITLLRRNDNE